MPQPARFFRARDRRMHPVIGSYRPALGDNPHFARKPSTGEGDDV